MEANEKWQSTVPGRIVVRFNSVNGSKDQLIQPGKAFSISTVDRRANQNAVASPLYDPFTNGSFVPVELPAEAVEELGVQPNHVSDDAVLAIALGARVEAIDELKKLTAPAVVGKVLAAARELGASDERIGMIEEFLKEIDPSLRPVFGRGTQPAVPYQFGRPVADVADKKAPEVNSLGEPVF